MNFSMFDLIETGRTNFKGQRVNWIRWMADKAVGARVALEKVLEIQWTYGARLITDSD